MFTTSKIFSLGFLIALTGLACVGCSRPYAVVNDEPPRVNRIARSQLPPEPVYNRLRWVHLPYTLPTLQQPESEKALMPIYHLELSENSLKEAAAALASTARYSSYCSDLIAEDVISMSTLGTIDELAKQIEEQAGIEVVVDHENKEIRFLPLDATSNGENV